MPRQPEWYADGTHPVVNVTWDEAQAYCEWAGGRLPTEEEWEHAARGGLDGKLFPWGDEFTGQANARHNLKTEQFDFTAPVASFPPNGFGLHDMAGNVWEWTASEFTLTHASDARRRRLRSADDQGRRMGQPHPTAARLRARGIIARRAGITCTSASDVFDRKGSGGVSRASMKTSPDPFSHPLARRPSRALRSG